MPDPLSELQRLGQEFDADGVEAVARAIGDAINADKEVFLTGRGVYEVEGELYIDVDGALALYPLARAAIEAARPMIEKEAFEKAAKVADEKAKYTLTDTARHAANAIRALGDRVG